MTKPRLLSSQITRDIALQVKNPRALLCYSMEAARLQIALDESRPANAPNWEHIIRTVTHQINTTFGVDVHVKIKDAETEELLNDRSGIQEADVVMVEVAASTLDKVLH